MNINQSPKIVPISSGHLTEVQFGELLDGTKDNVVNKTDRALSPAEEHLLTCAQCATELATLREALVLFREVSTAYAESELRNIPRVELPARRARMFTLRPAYFAAAAALLLASFIPIQMLHQRAQKAAQQAASATAATNFERYASESNEALLDDVNNAASASVPDSMQALADPMGTNDLSVQKSNQRKD